MWLQMQNQISMAHCFLLLVFPAPVIPPMHTEGLYRHELGPESSGRDGQDAVTLTVGNLRGQLTEAGTCTTVPRYVAGLPPMACYTGQGALARTKAPRKTMVSTSAYLKNSSLKYDIGPLLLLSLIDTVLGKTKKRWEALLHSDIFRIEIFLEESTKLIKRRKLKKHTRLRKLTTITGLRKPFPHGSRNSNICWEERLSDKPAHKSCKDQFLWVTTVLGWPFQWHSYLWPTCDLWVTCYICFCQWPQ